MLKKFLKRDINAVLSPFGIELVRKTPKAHNWNDPTEFIPFEETLAKAKQAGLTVGDYVDVAHNLPGATQSTIDQMTALGVFRGKISDVCEIGPGSGRYLEKVIRAYSPARYEIYETAQQWADYLVDKYGAILRPTDGKTLSSTGSSSIDLVQAHKVFVVTSFLTTCSYLTEMVRVLRPGGFAVFDIVTESCMDDETLERWMSSKKQFGPYPALLPKEFIIGFFRKRAFSFVGSFMVPMRPGTTECMVLVKNQGSELAALSQ